MNIERIYLLFMGMEYRKILPLFNEINSVSTKGNFLFSYAYTNCIITLNSCLYCILPALITHSRIDELRFTVTAVELIVL